MGNRLSGIHREFSESIQKARQYVESTELGKRIKEVYPDEFGIGLVSLISVNLYMLAKYPNNRKEILTCLDYRLREMKVGEDLIGMVNKNAKMVKVV